MVTKFLPGSFTKNFGNGLDFHKLTTAVANGFQRRLKKTSRNDWRENAGNPDRARDLIPLNFFLFNRDNEVLVDEFVEQCVKNADPVFLERVSLFALNLSNSGKWKESEGQLTGWHNEFIRTIAWKNGSWYAEAFSQKSLDSFINKNVDAVPKTKIKIRNNYRHLVKIAGVLEVSSGAVDLQPWSWGPSACRIFWDRLTYQGSLPSKTTKARLLEAFVEHETYKLLGCDKELGIKIASSTADEYLKVGTVQRYQ
jgi:hypothetical protein